MLLVLAILLLHILVDVYVAGQNHYDGFCVSNPCLNGYCVSNTHGYDCRCSYGFGGQNCENIITAQRRSSVALLQDPTLFEHNDHAYRVYTDAVDFMTASDTCVQMGGYLACMNTLDEYDVLSGMFSGASAFHDQAWVGFYWFESDTCLNDTTSSLAVCAWNLRCQPDATDGGEISDVWFAERTEHSLYFTPNALYPTSYWALPDQGYAFWDLHDSDSELAYICEFEVYCGGHGFSNPCMHNSVCLILSGNRFMCDCTGTNYTGNFCETELCDSGAGLVPCPCEANPCQRGVCFNRPNAQFACDCTGTGYEGNVCQSDRDECSITRLDRNLNIEVDICNNNGVCENTAGGFSCTCNEDYMGEVCDVFVASASSDDEDCEDEDLTYSLIFVGAGVIAGCLMFLCLFKKIARKRIMRATATANPTGTTPAAPGAAPATPAAKTKQSTGCCGRKKAKTSTKKGAKGAATPQAPPGAPTPTQPAPVRPQAQRPAAPPPRPPMQQPMAYPQGVQFDVQKGPSAHSGVSRANSRATVMTGRTERSALPGQHSQATVMTGYSDRSDNASIMTGQTDYTYGDAGTIYGDGQESIYGGSVAPSYGAPDSGTIYGETGTIYGETGTIYGDTGTIYGGTNAPIYGSTGGSQFSQMDRASTRSSDQSVNTIHFQTFQPPAGGNFR